MIESGWLAALKLPTKVIAGLFLTACVLLGLHQYEILDLTAFGTLARPAVFVLAILTGCLLLASIIELAAQPKLAKQKASLLAERRQIRKDEREADLEKNRAKALESLDHLSGWELRIVADALNEGSPSFYTYVYSPPVAQLQTKKLVYSGGGTHHQDHYPFTFHDFAWKALLDRKDEFLEKAKEAEAREEEKKRQGRRRR